MSECNTSQKVLSRGAAARWVKKIQAQGRTAVFTNGCFDLLHPGHVAYLEQARSLGDALIVGVNTDESVRRLCKGPGRPVTPEADRARVLAALTCVDRVVLFPEDTPLELLSASQVLHHDVRAARFLGDVKDSDDVRMRREAGGGPRLPLEPADRGIVAGEPPPEHLDRHLAIEPEVVRPPHQRHPPTGDPTPNLVPLQQTKRLARPSALVAPRRPHHNVVPRTAQTCLPALRNRMRAARARQRARPRQPSRPVSNRPAAANRFSTSARAGGSPGPRPLARPAPPVHRARLNTVLDRHVILDFEEVAVSLTVPTSPRPTPNALLDALGDVVLDQLGDAQKVRIGGWCS